MCVQMEMVSLKLVPGIRIFSKAKVHLDIIVKGSFQNSSSLQEELSTDMLTTV